MGLRRVIHRFTYLVLVLIIVSISTLLFLLNSTKMLQWAADTYGPHYHLGYKEISGSLLSGIEIQELTFEEELLLDHLKIGWNPAALLYKRVSFTHLEASGLHVNHIGTTAKKLLPQKAKENQHPLVIPFSIGVEALRLTIKPFEESGIGFKDGLLEGKEIVYYGEGIDVDELLLSIDSNLTTIQLTGGIDDKEIKVEELRILNFDTLAFEDVIKKMIAIRLQEKIVEQVEPEIEDYRAGRENYIPKSVSIDSAMVTLKVADHAQVRLNQGELRVDSLKADIYKMIEYQPDTVQVLSLIHI